MFSWIHKNKTNTKLSESNKTEQTKLSDKTNIYIDTYSDLNLDKLC